MEQKLKVFLFLIILSTHPARAQNMSIVDSLQHELNMQQHDSSRIDILTGLFNATLYNNPDEAKKYAAEKLELAQKLNRPEDVAKALYQTGVYFNNLNQPDSAKKYYYLSLQQFKKLNNSDGQTDVNFALAIVEYSQGNYDKSLAIIDNYIETYSEDEAGTPDSEDLYNLALFRDLKGQVNLFKGNYNIALTEILGALEIIEDLNKPIRKADILNHVASVEFCLEHFESSVANNLEALKIYRQHNDKFFEAQILNDIGNTYYYLENYEESIDYLEQSLQLSEGLGDTSLKGTALNNLGKVYTRLGDFQTAVSLLNQGLNLHEKNGSKQKIAEVLNDLGEAYKTSGQTGKALFYTNKAILIADSIGLKEPLKSGYFRRSFLNESTGNYQQALHDFKLYNSVSDSILNQAKIQQIEELRTIYETEKKEQEIALQKNTIEILEQKERIARLQKSFLTAGVLFLILILLLGYYTARQKMKRNRLEKEKVDAELEFKKKELTGYTMHLAHKNELLESLRENVVNIRQNGNPAGEYKQLVQSIDFELRDENNWENFRLYFEAVHHNFNQKIKAKYPDITSNELRLIALIKMNLSTKKMANILNISQEGIKKARYRLRKKLQLSFEDSLQDFILNQ